MTASQSMLVWRSLKGQSGRVGRWVYDSPAWRTIPRSIIAARRASSAWSRSATGVGPRVGIRAG